MHWLAFLERLKTRRLGGMQLIISDDHAGLKTARLAVLGSIPPGLFVQDRLAAMPVSLAAHRPDVLRENAQAYVQREEMQAEVTEDIRTIFQAPDQATAETRLAKAVQKYEKSAFRLSEWTAVSIPEGSTVFAFPMAHRKLIRTTNGVERWQREVHRRARVVSIFPNQASCLRLVSAILNEISEEWLTGRTYLSFQGAD